MCSIRFAMIFSLFVSRECAMPSPVTQQDGERSHEKGRLVEPP
jgi:hypothetical protein